MFNIRQMKIDALESLMSDLAPDDPMRAQVLASADRDDRPTFVDQASGLECESIHIPSLLPPSLRLVE